MIDQDKAAIVDKRPDRGLTLRVQVRCVAKKFVFWNYLPQAYVDHINFPTLLKELCMVAFKHAFDPNSWECEILRYAQNVMDDTGLIYPEEPGI